MLQLLVSEFRFRSPTKTHLQVSYLLVFCPFWPHTTLNLARRNVIIFATSAHSPFPYIHENYSGPLNLFSALLRWPWLMLLRPTEEDWELYGACVEGDTWEHMGLSDWMFCPHSTSAYKNAHEKDKTNYSNKTKPLLLVKENLIVTFSFFAFVKILIFCG